MRWSLRIAKLNLIQHLMAVQVHMKANFQQLVLLFPHDFRAEINTSAPRFQADFLL
ncbi:hypothetical protein D3C71_2070740 [compost metagenome]